jgi:hypothetical protein
MGIFSKKIRDSVSFGAEPQVVNRKLILKNAVFWDLASCRSCVNGRSSETSINTRSTLPHRPEDCILNGHRCENIKSYKTNLARKINTVTCRGDYRRGLDW